MIASVHVQCFRNIYDDKNATNKWLLKSGAKMVHICMFLLPHGKER